jgi:RNA polymerase sigma-70 factor (ECF subfamily)
MPTRALCDVLQLLRDAVALDDATDGTLLERFLRSRDECAFAALMRRHGPMVWGVCRRMLANAQDAEDAFQATFVVLARKASSIVPTDMVGNWLYGVAYQTARKARMLAARRGTRERQVSVMPEPLVEEEARDEDLDVLDQELSHLPDKYRAVIVLCDLEGKTRKEVARQLACPEGTVAGRLARARALLAKRMQRHGLAGASVPLATVAVPRAVESATLQALQGTLSAPVGLLVEGVLKMMLLKKLKLTVAVVLVLAVVGFGAGWQFMTSHAAEPADEKKVEAKQADKKPAVAKAEDDGDREKRMEAMREKQVMEELDRLKATFAGKDVNIYYQDSPRDPTILRVRFAGVVEIVGKKFLIFEYKDDKTRELVDPNRVARYSME